MGGVPGMEWAKPPRSIGQSLPQQRRIPPKIESSVEVEKPCSELTEKPCLPVTEGG